MKAKGPGGCRLNPFFVFFLSECSHLQGNILSGSAFIS
jgi:hypothetical protein